FAPPEIPASTYATPRCASAAWMRSVDSGAAVERSTTTWPSRQCSSTPPSPSTTGSMIELSGSESSTTSACATSSASDATAGRPVADRVGDVLAQADAEHVRRRGVERAVDELLDLRLERAVLPGVRGHRRVGREELRVQPQEAVPEAVPVAALGGELGLDLL